MAKDGDSSTIGNGANAAGAAGYTAAAAAGDAASAARNTGDTIREGAERAGDAMKESGRKIVESGSTIGAKMVDQAEQNAREAFAAMREAASAKDLSDVMKIQGDYLRQQGQRSMNQAREISELIMQFGRDAIAPLRGDGPK